MTEGNVVPDRAAKGRPYTWMQREEFPRKKDRH